MSDTIRYVFKYWLSPNVDYRRWHTGWHAIINDLRISECTIDAWVAGLNKATVIIRNKAVYRPYYAIKLEANCGGVSIYEVDLRSDNQRELFWLSTPDAKTIADDLKVMKEEREPGRCHKNILGSDQCEYKTVTGSTS